MSNQQAVETSPANGPQLHTGGCHCGAVRYRVAIDTSQGGRCNCSICNKVSQLGGMVKPDVVFFGENVPGDRYESAREALANADALLVAGSSLMVYSGFRFVRLANDAGLPIAIVNRGRTRGDDLAGLKIESDVGSALADAVAAQYS